MSKKFRTSIQLVDGAHFVFGTTTGSQVGTSTSQKLAFYGSTPIIQPANSVDIVTLLTNLGLRASGGNPNLTLGTGSITCGSLTANSSLVSNGTFSCDAGQIYSDGSGGFTIGYLSSGGAFSIDSSGNFTTQGQIFLGGGGANAIYFQDDTSEGLIANWGMGFTGNSNHPVWVGDLDRTTNPSTTGPSFLVGINAPVVGGSDWGNGLLYAAFGMAIGFTSPQTIPANGILIADSSDIQLGTSTGTKIGTAASQKLGFFGATPVIQQVQTTDLRTALINLGLIASTSGATPLNLNGGAFTSASVSTDTHGPRTATTTSTFNLGTAFTAAGTLTTFGGTSNYTRGATTNTDIGFVISQTFTGSVAAGTDKIQAFAITPTYNLTGVSNASAVTYDLFINRTETSVVGVGGGNWLIWAGVAGTSKFTVDNTGGCSGLQFNSTNGFFSTTFRATGGSTTNVGGGTYSAASNVAVSLNNGTSTSTSGTCYGVQAVTTVAPTSSSASYRSFGITPTYNQTTSSGDNYDLYISRTETAISSGAQWLIWAGITSTAKFTVDRLGAVAAGSLTLTTALPLGSGGTGATTQGAAANAILPTQTSNTGKFLSTDGTNASWAVPTTGAGGSTTQIQFNNAGTLSGTAGMTWDSTNQSLTLAGAAQTGSTSNVLLSLTQTWNTTGNPTGIKLNITNTASGTSSMLLDLQVGSVSKYSVDTSGNMILPDNTTISWRDSVAAARRVFLVSSPGGRIAFGDVDNSFNYDTYYISSGGKNTKFLDGTGAGSGNSMLTLSKTGITVVPDITFNAASGQTNVFTISSTYSQSGGTTSNTDFKINRTGTTGSGTQLLMDLQVSSTSKMSVAADGTLTATKIVISQVVATTGTPSLAVLTGAAHTTLTASTEATDVNFNLARTVQFSTGALTTQRAIRFQAPTYGFVGASTITRASTIHVSGAPIAGTNATITTGIALDVDTGYAAAKGLVIRGAASQSGNLLEFQDSTSANLASVTSAGVFTGSGAGLTALNGTNIGSGTVPAARLGSGTANSTVWLRGDNTWTTVTAAPGGSTTQIQYNNAGAMAGIANLTWNSTNSALLLSGTSPNTTPSFSINPTWTSSGTAYAALYVNAVNTASTTTSTLISLNVGGLTKFVVYRTGQCSTANNTIDDGSGNSSFGAISTGSLFSSGTVYTSYNTLDDGGGGAIISGNLLVGVSLQTPYNILDDGSGNANFNGPVHFQNFTIGGGCGIYYDDDPSEYFGAAWGVGMHGNATHPLYVPDCSLLIGIDNNTMGSTNWGVGNLYVINTSTLYAASIGTYPATSTQALATNVALTGTGSIASFAGSSNYTRSGTQTDNGLSLAQSFSGSVASGTNNLRGLNLSPTYNLTGTSNASANVYDLYINRTETSMVGVGGLNCLIWAGVAGTARFILDRTGKATFTPAVSTTGSPNLLVLTGPAHTTLTASTEATDVNLNLARTVQFATGALTTQRALRIQNPTYGFVGASTITKASTVHISGAPLAGTNCTITQQIAFEIDTGADAAKGLVVRANSGTQSANVAEIQSSAGAVVWGVDKAGTVTHAESANMVFGTTTGSQIATSTSQKIGFYGATPVVQQTGTTDLRTALINLGLYASGGASPLNLNGGALTAAAITGTTATFTKFTVDASGNALFGDNTSTSTATPVHVSFGGTYGTGTPGSAANLKWMLYNDSGSGGTGSGYYGIGMSAGLMELRAGSTAAIGIFPNNGTESIRFDSTGIKPADGVNFVLGSTTGSKIGTATSQKLAFFNSTPITQPSSTTDLRTALINLGLYATGGASPLNLNGGAFTAATITLTGSSVTTSSPVVSWAQTWNGSGVSFTGFLFNVTDTLSAAGSFLMDLQVGSTTKCNVSKEGAIQAAGRIVGGTYSNATATGTITIDARTVQNVDITATGNVTLTFTNMVNNQTIHIKFKQDATGSRTLAITNQNFGDLIPALTVGTSGTYYVHGGANKKTHIGIKYDTGSSTWDVLSAHPNFS